MESASHPKYTIPQGDAARPGEDTPGPNGHKPHDSETAQFFQMLLGNGLPPEAEAHVWWPSPTHTEWIRNVEAAKAAIQRYGVSDAYFGVGLGPPGGTSKERVKKSTAAGLLALGVDIDYGDTHNEKALPENRDMALWLLRQIGLPPTIIVDSGHGIHAWWIFKVPWLFAGNDVERQRAVRLSTAFQRHLQRIANEYGWKLDDVGDLARILRVPGTTNAKNRRRPVPVRLLELARDARYTPEDIESFLGEAGRADADDGTHTTGGDGVDSSERYTAEHPCPICAGYQSMPPGIGERCWGFAVGDVAYCTREQYAGDLANITLLGSRAWAHSLSGRCGCGERHGTAGAVSEDGMATWAARQYLRAYGDNLRYVHAHRRWFHWNQQIWEPDGLQEAARLGQKLIIGLYDEARTLPDEAHRKPALMRVLKLDTASTIHGIVGLAAQWTPIRAKPEGFDRDPWLASVANGTLDLRLEQSPDSGTTALLREHRQEDMLTRRLGKGGPLAYNPAATCPNWLAFLDRILVKPDRTPDAELIAYLRRWGGYTLTGLVIEQMLLVCWGTGQNGKRTFTQALEEILGTYAETISIETLLAQRFEGNAGPAELAKLDGARFVQTGENDAGRSLNEARLKLLTGGDPVPARHLRGDPFFYDPQFKLLLHTNHKPKIRGRDKGIWRRVKLIPFTVTIPDDERDPLFFEHKLRAELPGILAWFVGGCLEWQRLGGLKEPKTVTAATAEYRDTEDIVKQFVAEWLVVKPEASDLQKTVHSAFQGWCNDEGIRQKVSSQAFAERVVEITHCERKRGDHGQEFIGLRLRLSSDTDMAEHEPVADYSHS